jgi:autotransporter-associated beta strand protein
VNGDIIRGSSTGISTASLTLNGGTLDMGGKRIGGVTAGANLTSITFASGTLKNVADINTGGALNKTTAGTLTIDGTNTYTGATNVNEGTVVVSGSLSGSTVSVASGAELRLSAGTITTPAALSVAGTLSGAGTVDGGSGAIDVAATGSVSSGTGNDSAGLLNATSLTTSGDLTNKATLRMELLSDSSYDRIATTEAINLASGENTTLTLLVSGSYVPVSGTMFFIVTNSSANAATTGLFAGTVTQTVTGFESLGAVPTMMANNGQLFAISYGGDFEAVGGPAFTGGNDVVLMAVPEPNGLAMLAGSLGLALGLQRFRRRI